MNDTDVLLTVPQAARMTALKEATIRRRILERRIGYVKLGRSVRIPLQEVEKLIRRGYRPPIGNE